MKRTLTVLLTFVTLVYVGYPAPASTPATIPAELLGEWATPTTQSARGAITSGSAVDGVKRRVAQESLVLLKKTFPYQPTVSQETEAKKESDGVVVKMEPFVVVESSRQRELRAKIESESQKKKNEQFSIIKGGSIYKKGRIEIGAWGDSSGLTILKISW